MDMKEDSFNQKVFNFLRKEKCCLTCCLRYLNGHGKELLDVKSSLEQKGIVITQDDEDTNELQLHSCPCCLGIFSEVYINETLEKVNKDDTFSAFKCRKFVLSLSLPVALDVRQVIIWIKLIKEFGDVISKDERLDTTPKDALRSILTPKLCQELKAKYDRDGVMITINYKYPFGDFEYQEAELLGQIKPQCFQIKHGNKTEVNRTAVEKHLVPLRLKPYECKEILNIPYNSGWYSQRDNRDKELQCSIIDRIENTGPTIFVAGRYEKFSRELSQTPWVIEGKRMMKNSVQEIIEGNLIEHFKDRPMSKSKICFSASGREDVDVRCLGRGRPFVLEITNSYISHLPPRMGLAIQEEIAKSHQVSVRDLQIVDRAQLVHIKEGEEHKKKMYRALCHLEHPATVEVLKKLNISKTFLIEQFTPIRVLHRRALMKRLRAIYSVNARLSKEHNRLLVIDIQTQAGTYVKELVHGEFGRTQPSLASIIGQKIDILSLDVTDIDINWPQPVDYAAEEEDKLSGDEDDAVVKEALKE